MVDSDGDDADEDSDDASSTRIETDGYDWFDPDEIFGKRQDSSPTDTPRE